MVVTEDAGPQDATHEGVDQILVISIFSVTSLTIHSSPTPPSMSGACHTSHIIRPSRICAIDLSL